MEKRVIVYSLLIVISSLMVSILMFSTGPTGMAASIEGKGLEYWPVIAGMMGLVAIGIIGVKGSR